MRIKNKMKSAVRIGLITLEPMSITYIDEATADMERIKKSMRFYRPNLEILPDEDKKEETPVETEVVEEKEETIVETEVVEEKEETIVDEDKKEDVVPTEPATPVVPEEGKKDEAPADEDKKEDETGKEDKKEDETPAEDKKDETQKPRRGRAKAQQ